jgi:hypothetical protein
MSVQRRVIQRAVALAAASGLAFTACGDDKAETAERSPLEQLFGGEESPAELRKKQLQQEEVVAQCMKDAGWEYTPVDYSSQFPDDGGEEDYASPEFAKKYGYGIVHNYEIYELPYLDENGEYTGEGPGGGFVDPNQEYVGSLSQEEQDDYYAALYGEPITEEASGEDVTADTILVPSPEEQGCQGKAQLEVYGDQPWNDEDFNVRYEELLQQLENDPRVEEAEIAWSDCLYEIDPSYDLLTPEETYQFMEKLMVTAKGQKIVPVDPDTGEVIGGDGTEQIEGWTSTEDGEAYGYIGKQKRISEEDLVELQAEELTLYNADQECQKSSGLKKLRKGLEQELADALLEEFPDIAANQS